MMIQSRIPQKLQSLAEEARKYKSVEEFGKAVAIKRTMMQVRQVTSGVGFEDEVIGGISQSAFSDRRDDTATRRCFEEKRLLITHGFLQSSYEGRMTARTGLAVPSMAPLDQI